MRPEKPMQVSRTHQEANQNLQTIKARNPRCATHQSFKGASIANATPLQ
jgi:hypothetical protein